ncbi:large conductance mechanosensitive channel protein MscL [Neobacillus sp. K501]
MLNEFKKFAMRGNVIDLAVGVIIGGAFGKIVSSLVNDVIMPLVGLLLGGVDFKSLAITVGKAKLSYGLFLQTVVDFLIISFSIFLFIRFLNRFKKKEEPAKEVVQADKKEVLLAEIRDLLKEEKDFSRKNETS